MDKTMHVSFADDLLRGVSMLPSDVIQDFDASLPTEIVLFRETADAAPRSELARRVNLLMAKKVLPVLELYEGG